MSKERPMIVTLMGDINILGALLIIISLLPFVRKTGIIIVKPDFFNISVFPVEIIKIIMAVILLLISYGYLKLKKWGYWCMIGKDLLFLAGWLISYFLKQETFFNPISTIIEMIFVLPTIKYFYKKPVTRRS